MFTGARDFNINSLDIISAGRDVNINVITTASAARTLDLQALFSGNLDTPRIPTARHSESPISKESNDGGTLLVQPGKDRHRGFKRAIYGAFGKRKGQGSKDADGCAKTASIDMTQSSTLGDISTAEVYVRGLLESGNGLPCWDPKPHGRDVETEGIVPGDVGIYTAERGFEKIFNLWEDEVGIQGVAESMGAAPYRPPKRTILRSRNAMDEGEVVAKGAYAQPIESTSPTSEGPSLGFEFNLQGSSDGAILAITSPADLEAVEDLTVLHMRESIIQHAGVLYLYANRVRRLQSEDCSLYVVTGCVKTDAWALGAFRKRLDGGTVKLVRNSGDNEQGDTPVYQWNTPGSIWADLFTGQNSQGKKNQTLFLRGFKIGFSQAFRFRIARSENSGLPTPSFRGSPESTYHPCDVINDRLLNQTGVDIALSHDDNWRFLFKRATLGKDADVLNLESLTFKGHAHVASHLQISIRNGVAYIDFLEHGEEENRIKQNNRQKELDIIQSDASNLLTVENMVFSVIPEAELALVHPLGGIGYHPIAHGGHADFYMGSRKVGGIVKKVVVKVFRSYKSHQITQNADLDALRHEYSILGLLSHPNVIRLEGLTRIDGIPGNGMVLEYKFGNLPGFLKRSFAFDRMTMAKGIFRGLAYIHSMQIVHGNLEPRKILVELDSTAGDFFPVICGFRSSRRMNEVPTATKPSRSGGTGSGPEGPTQDGDGSKDNRIGMTYVAPVWYRSPELLKDMGRVDDDATYASDVFSLGLVIQELLTGKPPYTREIIPKFRLSDRLGDPEASPRHDANIYPMIDEGHNFVWPILEDCWKVDPTDRITSAEACKRLCEGASHLASHLNRI